MNAISAATDKDKCAKFIHNMQNEKGSQMASLTQFWKKCQLRRLVMKATKYAKCFLAFFRANLTFLPSFLAFFTAKLHFL